MAPKTTRELEDAVIVDYKDGVVLERIAERHGVTRRTISAIRKRRGVERRTACVWTYRGSAHINWRGGTHYMHGYVRMVLDRDDPLYSMATKNGFVLEHRLVMARSIGRPLRRDETVHHKNGIRDDNRIENLELWQGNHGRGVRYRCSDCGSHNLEAI